MRLSTADVLKLVPEFMRDDEAVKGLAAAVNKLIREPGQKVKTVRVWDQIDELDDAQLDELAYELDIDWYSSGLPLENKRAVIKISDLVHSRRGTKWAVEELISAYISPGFVEEWHEEGYVNPKPFHFSVYTSHRHVTDAILQEFKAIAKVAMSVRSRLDGVPAKVGVDYEGTGWAKGTATSEQADRAGAAGYLEFSNGTTRKSVVGGVCVPINSSSWTRFAVRGTATDNHVSVMGYSYQATISDMYVDDAMLWEITPAGILDEIDTLVRAGKDADTLYERLGSGTLFYVEPFSWLTACLFVLIPYYCMRNRLLPKEDGPVKASAA